MPIKDGTGGGGGGMLWQVNLPISVSREKRDCREGVWGGGGDGNGQLYV